MYETQNQTFAAPELIEKAIVHYGHNVLEIPFGEYWYRWFVSNNPSNKSIQFYSQIRINTETIRKTIVEVPELKIVKIHKIQEISHEVVGLMNGFKYMYQIHIKTEE